MLHARRAVDLHVQPDALADVLDADQIAGLADIGEVERGIESRPMDALVLVEDAARDVEAPGRLVGLIGEALERNGELRHPAVLHDSRARLPDRVPLAQFLGVVEFELVGAPA